MLRKMGRPRKRKDLIARRLAFSTRGNEYFREIAGLAAEGSSPKGFARHACDLFCIFVEISLVRAIKMADGSIGRQGKADE